MDRKYIQDLLGIKEVQYDQKPRYETPKHVIITECTILIFGILANFTIIFTIFKKGALHFRPYSYVAHWSFCNFLALLHIFATSKLSAKLDWVNITCDIDLVRPLLSHFLFMTGNELFVCVMIIDWYIITFDSENSSLLRFNKSFFIWLSLILWRIYLQAACIFDKVHLYYNVLCFIIIYFFSLIIITIMFALRCEQLKHFHQTLKQSRFEFILAFSFLFFWNFNIIVMVFWYLSGPVTQNFLQITLFIGFSHSSFLLIVLFFDEKFREAFISFFVSNRRDVYLENQPVVFSI